MEMTWGAISLCGEFAGKTILRKLTRCTPCSLTNFGEGIHSFISMVTAKAANLAFDSSRAITTDGMNVTRIGIRAAKNISNASKTGKFTKGVAYLRAPRRHAGGAAKVS